MNLDVTVDALGSSETNQRSIDYDVILLAPQVRYQKANFVKASGGKVPVEPIDMVAYGTLDGKKALKAALKAVEEFKKQ